MKISINLFLKLKLLIVLNYIIINFVLKLHQIIINLRFPEDSGKKRRTREPESSWLDGNSFPEIGQKMALFKRFA